MQDDGERLEFDTKEKRILIYGLWRDLFDVAEVLVTAAKADPKNVKASLLAQIIRLLDKSTQILNEIDNFRATEQAERDADDDDYDDTDEDDEYGGMTASERKMVEEFEASHHADAGADGDNVGADTGGSGGESSIKGELKAGFNYKRN